MKRSFFQAAVTSILLYGCTTWTLTKRLEKKLDGNYTRMLRAILNKSWRQHPTRHQLYGHLPPITKTIQVRWTKHAGHCWRSRDELIRDVLLWTPTHGRAKQDDQHEHTFSSYVRIRDVVLKTCLGRWTIGRSGERGSGISVLPARHDDDEYLVGLLYNQGMIFFILIIFSLIIFYHSFWLGFELFESLSPGAYSLGGLLHPCTRDMTITICHNKLQIGNGAGVWMTSCLEEMVLRIWGFWKESVEKLRLDDGVE